MDLIVVRGLGTSASGPDPQPTTMTAHSSSALRQAPLANSRTKLKMGCGTIFVNNWLATCRLSITCVVEAGKDHSTNVTSTNPNNFTFQY